MMRSRPAPASRANKARSPAKNGLDTPFDTYQKVSPEGLARRSRQKVSPEGLARRSRQKVSPEVGCTKAVTGGDGQPLVAVMTQRDRPLAFGRPHPPDDRL